MKEEDASDPASDPAVRAGAAEEIEPLAFEATEADAGERLDAYLAARIEGWSRARLQRLIDDGDVLVEGATRKPSYKLRAGEHVEVELAAAPAALHLTPENIPLDIVHEDGDIVVVNKPAGMVVHPAAGVRSGTLANALAYRFEQSGDASPQSANPRSDNPPSAIGVSPSSIRPGIVHRLDRDTSGLIVVAKNERAHEHLAEQFRAREVFKSYVALVHGIVGGRDAQTSERAGAGSSVGGRIEQPIGRNPRHRTEMAVVRGGRPSLTLYRVRRWLDRFTLLDVEIKTGRTHQIRVHMAWLKHPVVGDGTYGAGRDGNVPDKRVRALIAALNRQFLHAEQLRFIHPRTHETMHFNAPLAPELDAFLAGLESISGAARRLRDRRAGAT